MEDFLSFVEYANDDSRIKGIIEALLFASGDPLTLKDIVEVTEINEAHLRRLIDEMVKEYEQSSRGLYIIEFNNKVQLCTKPQYGEYIKRLIKPENRQNLSHAALEALAIVAYKQPITKVEIDEIRGVRSDRAITTLIEHGLIKENGRKETTGRPILYITTEEFLKYFGFKNLNELPELIEFNMDYVEE